MQNNSFSKNSLITLLTEILLFIFGLVYLIILTRVLGPAGKGIYSLIILVPALMLSFGSLGLESANVYFIGKRKYNIKDIISNSLVMSVFLGVILIFAFFILSKFYFFKNFLDSSQISLIYLWLIVLTIPLSLFLSLFRNIIKGAGEITNFNKTRILESFIGLVSVIVLLLILKQGIFGAILAYIIALIAGIIFVIYLVKKIANFSASINFSLLKDSFIYGGKVYLANTISFLNYRLDMLLIAIFLAPAEVAIQVGFYSIAVGMAEKIFIIPGALSTVLFPKVSSIENYEADNLTPKVVRHTFFIVLVVSFLLLFLANPLIIIAFGKEFLASVLPFIFLLPGIIAFSVGGVIAADLSGRGKPQYAIYSSITGLILNIILNIILIPRYGIAGAAVASSISYWADTFIVLRAFIKISGKSLFEVLIIKKQDFRDYYNLFLKLREGK
ncbi:oligosaccharide flippase family protein [Patescibacteria group bacterium]|nr:oligosaccharide flippase family protein [Patescibacteria group bacterium]